MKKFFTVYASILALACVFGLFSACSGRTKTADYALSSEFVSIDKGATYDLSIEYDAMESYDFDVEWISDDPQIADVVNGTVYGIGGGITTVWAKLTVHKEDEDEVQKLRCTVTVNAKYIPVTGISFSDEALTVMQYTKTALKPVVEPEDADISGLIWSSSDETVIAVDETGVISALNQGKAVITVSAGAGGPGASVTVSVEENPDTSIVSSIVLDHTSLSIYEGRTVKLDAAVSPENYDGDVIYSTSNSSVASVTSDGVIKGISEGTASISVTAGGVTEYCSVTVLALREDFVAAERVVLDRSSVRAFPGSKFSLSATTYPFNSTQSGKWSTSNEAVASVDGSGNVTVTGTEGTSSVITYRISDSVYAQCEVSVVAEHSAAVSVSLNPSELTLEAGSGSDIEAVLSPSTATDTIVWSSSDPGVVTVDGGRVTALKAGEAVISAVSAEDPSVKASCKVTVVSDIREISFVLNEGQALAQKKFYSPVFSESVPQDAEYRISISDKSVIMSTKSVYEGPDKISFYAMKPGSATINIEVVSQGSVLYVIDSLKVTVQ